MDWGSAIGGFIAGLVGGFAFKVVIDARRSTNINRSEQDSSQGSVSQSGNLAGGDIAGRDITKPPK